MEFPGSETVSKHPIALAVAAAVAIGFVLLSRGGGGGSNAGASLASQSIATNADLTYSHDQTAQHADALNYQLGVASLNAGIINASMSAQTKLAAASITAMNADTMAGIQARSEANQVNAALQAANGRNATMLDLARTQTAYQLAVATGANATALSLAGISAGLQTNLAQISAGAAEQLASINSSTQRDIAGINADVAKTQSKNQLKGQKVNAITKLASGLIGAASF